MVLVPSGPQLLACSFSDSGVRREGRETGKKIRRKSGRGTLLPLPHPPPPLFSAHTSLRCHHDLNAWNRLTSCVERFQHAPWLACKKKAIVDLP